MSGDGRDVRPLPRHTLVWPAASARRRLAAQAPDELARRAVDMWMSEGFPLVVRRVDVVDALHRRDVALGLPLPPALGKRRLAFGLPGAEIDRRAPAASLRRIAAGLPAPWHESLTTLDRDARALGVTLRGFGSAAWQALTGLAYLRDDSDVDLICRPRSASQLDAVLALFDGWEERSHRRIDAEIVFAGGRAVAWREWQRTGPSSLVVVKSPRGAALVARDALLERLSGVAA
jgi:phosphoribosyl-dephospho-CoA transferase